MRALVGLIRQEDYDALLEFSARYAPLLLGYAEQAGVRVPDVETVAADVLGDVAAALIAMGSGLPSCSMETYVVRAFQNRLTDIYRRSIRDAESTGGPDSVDEGSPWLAGCSEGSVRASAGPDVEWVRLSPALERLSTFLDEGLSRDERELLCGVSAWASQSEIAEWLGTTHAAVRKQLERLRKRLTVAARAYTAALTGAERTEIRRFFRLVNAVIGDDAPPPTDGSTRRVG